MKDKELRKALRVRRIISNEDFPGLKPITPSEAPPWNNHSERLKNLESKHADLDAKYHALLELLDIQEESARKRLVKGKKSAVIKKVISQFSFKMF